MGRKRKHGWHLFICQDCGRRWWTHSKNPRYGKQPCAACQSSKVKNHGFDDPAEA